MLVTLTSNQSHIKFEVRRMSVDKRRRGQSHMHDPLYREQATMTTMITIYDNKNSTKQVDTYAKLAIKATFSIHLPWRQLAGGTTWPLS